jgi:hypothetical protein
MSAETDQARVLAERIARRVATTAFSNPPTTNAKSEVAGEIAAMRAGLGEMLKRLTQLEAKVRDEPATLGSTFKPTHTHESFVPPTHSPWLAGVNAAPAHVSEERFGVEEAAVNELVDFFQNEKMCSIDPSGKPCDHCAMCSSRGF